MVTWVNHEADAQRRRVRLAHEIAEPLGVERFVGVAAGEAALLQRLESGELDPDRVAAAQQRHHGGELAADRVQAANHAGAPAERNDGDAVRRTIPDDLGYFFVIGGQQHVDNHTLLDHAEPNCPSHELYKHVLSGKSTAVFKGKILVRQVAQKTNSA